MTPLEANPETAQEDGERYVNGRLDLSHAPSLGTFIGKTLASFVSGNNMPHISGDDRLRMHAHVRTRYDRACEKLAADILAAQPAPSPVGIAAGDAPNPSRPTTDDVARDFEILGELRDGLRSNAADVAKRLPEAVVTIQLMNDRADALTRILDLLPTGEGWRPDPTRAEAVACEGCSRPSEQTDNEGIPLCAPCLTETIHE